MSRRWHVVSCVTGEPDQPRVIDGESSWATRDLAEQALERMCDQLGCDPDDFTTEWR